MISIVLISWIFFYSVVSGSPTQGVAENNQTDWSFGITNIPSATAGWLIDQVYTPTSTSPQKSADDLEKEKNANLVVDFDGSVDEPESTKKVDDILNIIHGSSDDEKKEYASFLENLEDKIINDQARYVKVFLKNMWHVVDLGVFNSGERRRNAENVKSLLQTIKDLIYEILASVFNFLTGKIEDGKKGTQRIWATLEQTKEGDHREWSEDEALKKLSELEMNYKNMKKDDVIRDITSLSLQPLYKASTYNKIREFLEKLKKEGGFEMNAIDKDLYYVDYKSKFSNDHNIK